MKRIYTIILTVLITATVFAQSPEKMSYQAVIRNSSDQLVTNQKIGMQVSILQGSATGVAVYVETQTPTTNANGLVTIEIGTGTTTNDFSAIDWSNSIYFIKTEADPAGGTDYTITGTSQLLSVPYALHAKTAENINYSQITNTPVIPGDISDLTDNTNLLFDGNYNSLSNLPSLFDGNYNSLSNLPTLFSGSYTDLTNKPTTIAGYGITDAFDGNYNSLSNLPSLFSGSFADLTNKPTTIAGYGITDAFDGTWTSLSGKPTFATVATSGSYTDLTNKPTTITTAQASDIETNNAKVSYPTTDATKLSGIESGAEVNVNADWNATSGDSQILNKPNLSNYAEKSNVLQLDNTTTFTPDADYEPATKKYVDDKVSSSATQHYIGEEFGGGVVFYVDRTGEHGLIVSTVNISTGVRFGTSTTTGANSRHDGQFNTNLLDNSALADAAYKINEYNSGIYTSSGGYTDWYIPAIDELALLFYARYNVSKALESISGSDDFSFPVYWSSTEVDDDDAYNYITKYEEIEIRGEWGTSKGTLLGLRAIRAF